MKSVKIRGLTIGEGMPKICVPIVGRTCQEMLEAATLISTPAKKPDMAELRADWFEDIFKWDKTEELLRRIRQTLPDMPLLFTFRTKREGGEQEFTFEQYKELLLHVAASGLVDAVDVEAFSFEEPVEELVRMLRCDGVTVIGSNHDFEKTPVQEEIVRRLCKMRDMRMDIAKIAVMPVKKEDVLTLLSASLQTGQDEEMCPVITMSMSGQGVVSRLTGEVFTSAVTFASAGRASAPGQIDIEALKTVLEVIHESC